MRLKEIFSSQKRLKEVQELQQRLQSEISSATHFVKKIEKGELEIPYPGLETEEIDAASLPGSLISMRNQLIKLNEVEAQRKWATDGLTKFVEILRQQHSLEEMCFQIISNLIKHIKANQGNIYLADYEKKSLELKACYAYDRKKFIEQTFEFGEGIIGQVFLEKQSQLLLNVPEDYVKITSGLGEASPRSIVIVPLKVNEEVQGIIELASFNQFEPYHVEFLEKLGENIASSVASLKINEKTKRLLQQSQQQAEELRTQEEEMKQNMEEMQSTQEELARKEAESQSLLAALSEAYYVAEIDRNGTVISANELFGNLIQEKLNGKNYDTLIQSDEKEMAEVLASVLDGVSSSRISFYKFGSGKKWFYETFSPIYDNQKRIIKLLLIAADITQNKEQELELKEIQERLSDNLEDLQKQSEEIEKRNLKLEHFRTLQLQLTKNKELKTGNWPNALQLMLTTLSKELKIGRVSFWRLNKTGTHIDNEGLFLHAEDAYTLPDLQLKENDYPEYFKALKSEVTIVAKDALTDKATAEFAEGYLKPLGIGAMLDIPFFYEGELLGVFCCEHIGGQREWQNEDIDFVKSISDLATNVWGVYLQNQQKVLIEEEKARMESFINSSNDKIFILDTKSRIVQVNKGVRDFYSQNNVEIKNGISIYQVIAKEDRADTKIRVDKALAGETTTVEKRYRFKGIDAFFERTMFPIFSGSDIIGVGIIARDVSTQKQLQEEMKTKNEELLASEEELRQNLEELTTTQEMLRERNKEIEKIREKEKARADHSIQAQTKMMERFMKKAKLREAELMAKIKELTGDQ